MAESAMQIYKNHEHKTKLAKRSKANQQKPHDNHNRTKQP